MDLPTLYKKTATGATQFWHIYTHGNVITTAWGQIDGAEQVTKDVISEGKNVGRSNATTPKQQAEAEAQSQWEKKLKKGYTKTIAEAVAGKVDDCIAGGIFPMLAHKYSEKAGKIQWPAYTQPKFDGHRCIGVVENGKASLWSRTRKPITGLPHIVAALEKLGVDCVVDGELYHHDYRHNFEDLTGFIRNATPKPGHEVVQYHIYDVVMDGSFDTRHKFIRALNLSLPLVPVETVVVADEDALMSEFEGFLVLGYEGCMVRNTQGAYVNKRSSDLLKVKEFDSSEFKVVGIEEGRGKLAGHAIFVCDANGTQFRTKMKGDTAKLKEYFENPTSVIGRMLEVKYQGLTNKAGVPRFPVALRFRDDL